jgi:hypothetical protein
MGMDMDVMRFFYSVSFRFRRMLLYNEHRSYNLVRINRHQLMKAEIGPE